MAEYAGRFLDEAACQICDGFAVNALYFSVQPNVGRAFDKATEGRDMGKHPLTFRTRNHVFAHPRT
ncbi:MAG: hypothetical protein LBG43_08230 [Treponema sp.]|nr:hypothetical protein [Treponema sp.]